MQKELTDLVIFYRWKFTNSYYDDNIYKGYVYLDTNWEISQLFDKNLSQFIIYTSISVSKHRL